MHDPKVAILIISAPGKNERWDREKLIWRTMINQFPSNVHAYFIEGNGAGSKFDSTVNGDTITCGIKESFVPGILIKTITSLNAIPGYDFYVRTNLSTVVNVKRLMNMLRVFDRSALINTGFHAPKRADGNFLCPDHMRAKIDFMKASVNADVTYFGCPHPDNVWCLGWAMVFSASVADLLVKYMYTIDLERYDVPDDVMMGIMVGKHDIDLNSACQEHQKGASLDVSAVFHRCKFVSKTNHAKIMEQILNMDSCAANVIDSPNQKYVYVTAALSAIAIVIIVVVVVARLQKVTSHD